MQAVARASWARRWVGAAVGVLQRSCPKFDSHELVRSMLQRRHHLATVSRDRSSGGPPRPGLPRGHPPDQQQPPRGSQTCITVRHRASCVRGMWTTPHLRRRLTPSKPLPTSVSSTARSQILYCAFSSPRLINKPAYKDCNRDCRQTNCPYCCRSEKQSKCN